MAKFNSTQTIKTTNKSGHAAYSMNDKEKLVAQVLTSFFNEKKFYGDNTSDMVDLIKRTVAHSPEFIAKLAVFARREFNMRSVSHVLIAYLAHEPAGKPFTRKAVKAVCLRGDDATEIMACYLDLFGKPIPNALKKGIADVLQGYDEYTLAKYKGAGKAVKMRDLLCLCRPTPLCKEQSALWKKCLEDKLEVPYTWETELSIKGNTAGVWKELIDSGKVGYMALLRNLRNIIYANPSNIGKALQTIRNPAAVKRSKQLPFRFLSAYKELEGCGDSRIFDTLEDAIEASIENMPKLPGKTVIAVDMSGSMSDTISAKSKVRCYEIAMMLGLMANKICENSVFYTFNSKATKHPVSSRTGILHATLTARCSGGTNMYAPFEAMLAEKVKADRIIILSDNECNSGGGWYSRRPVQAVAEAYRKETGCDIWVHAIDLQGYGTQQFHGAKTNIIAGWSEKVFDFIKLAEQGEGNLQKTIEAYNY